MKKIWLSLLLVLALTIFLAVPVAAAEGSGETFDLQAAINQAAAGSLVTLEGNVTEDVTIDKNIYLDLDGYTVSGDVEIANGAELKLFDSATKAYSTENGYGKITGEVTGNIARVMNTPKAIYGNNYRYVVIKDNEGYHAHRFYISVKSTILSPTGPALNYRTVLRCDSVLAQYLNTEDGAYGVRVMAFNTDPEVNDYTRDGEGNPRVAFSDYSQDVAAWDGEDENSRVSQLGNILSVNSSLGIQTLAEDIQWRACAYIKVDDDFGSDVEIISSEVKKSLKDVVQDVEAKAVADPGSITSAQQEALAFMYAANNDVMKDWGLTTISGYTYDDTLHYACLCGDPSSTDNPCANAGHRKVAWTEWTDASTLPTVSGNYRLTVNNASMTITTVPQINGFVCIDLNGHQLMGQAPSVGASGVLNLVNHSATKSTYTIAASDGVFTVNGNVSLYGNIEVTGPNKFKGLIENYGHLNLYGADITSTSGRPVYTAAGSYSYMNAGTITGGNVGTSADGGAVVVSGTFELDAVDADTYATITGGTAKTGGNVYVGNGGVLNVKGGTVSNGVSTSTGGNVQVANGGTLNVSAGNITGGTSGTAEATANGGSIFATGANARVTISGGTISDGGATNVGGNMFIQAGASLEVSGGTISGGYKGTPESKNYDNKFANIYVYGGSEVTLSGGTIEGIAVYKSDTVTPVMTLSGDVQITNNLAGFGLKLSGVVPAIDDSEVPFTGSVVLTTGSGKIATTTQQKYVGNFSCGVVATSSESTVGKAAYFNAEENAIYIGATKTMCVCGGKAVGMEGHTCDDTVEFTAKTGLTQLPASGNIFLGGDTYLTTERTMSTDGGEFSIDLNGHDLVLNGTGADSRVFRIYNSSAEITFTINITDSVGGGRVYMTGTTSGKGYGGLAWAFESNAVINQFGGILDASNLVSAKGGAAVGFDAGTYNLYGGEIIGGTDNASTTAYGGGVILLKNANCAFNMYGGTITGGESNYAGGVASVSGTMTVKGGTINGGRAVGSNIDNEIIGSGGSIYVSSTGILNVSGGTINGGNAAKYGGNIYVATQTVTNDVVTGGKVTISGTAQVIGGKALTGGRGGNIYVNGGVLDISGGQILNGQTSNLGGNIQTWTGSTLTISGGTISGGTTTNAGNIVYANAYPYESTTVLSGGVIDGIAFAGTTNLTVSGDVTIRADENGTGLHLGKNVIVNIDDSTESFTGNIVLSNVNGATTNLQITKASNNKADYSAQIVPSQAGKLAWFNASDNCLYLRNYKMMCVCGGKVAEGVGEHKHQEVPFIEWTSNNSMPSEPGNYYFTSDVTITNKQVSFKTAGEYNIDLNGHNYYINGGHDSRMFRSTTHDSAANVTIGVTNSHATEGGLMKLDPTAGTSASEKHAYGAIVWFNVATNTFNLYDGTMDASAVVSDNGGAAIKLAGGTFNMYGGQIIGGKDDASVSSYGGGVATIESGATFNLYAGDITGGQSAYNGGSFFVSGTLNVKGGSISGGQVVDDSATEGEYIGGGNVYVNGGTLVLESGSISGGQVRVNSGATKAYVGGGNIYLNAATLRISGGSVSDGMAQMDSTNSSSSACGGNIYIANNSTMELSDDGLISGGSTAGTKGSNGGSVYLNGAKAALSMSGGTITGGTAKNVAGNLFVSGSASVTMSGGSIYGGVSQNANATTAANYANVQVSSGTLAMSGGTVSGVTVDGTGTLTLSGSAVINTYTNPTTQVTSIGLRLNKSILEIKDSAENPFTGSVVLSSWVQKVDGETNLLANAANTGADYSDKFTVTESGKLVVCSDNKLYYQSGKMMCVCGGKAVGVGDHECEAVKFVAWTSNNSLPTETGNYYLTSSVTIANHVTYKTEANVNIDMNGKNITLTADKSWSRVFRVRDEDSVYDGSFNVTIGLTNSQATGGVVSGNVVNNQTQEYGILVWLNETGHTFNLYNGTLSAAGMTSTNGGAAVKLSKGTFNMYGGQIIGGQDTNSHATSKNHGGGVATIESGAIFNLYAGDITGGVSAYRGGAFNVKGTLNVKGGTITGSETASGNGGTIAISGQSAKAVISGDAQIIGGKAKAGGSIYVNAGTLEVTGGTISGGEATSGNGGNINATGATANVLVSGGTITGGNASNVTGNVFIDGDATLEVSGGSIYGGMRKGAYNDKYSNIQIYNGSAVLSGGTVSGITVDVDGTLTLSGSAVINTYTDPTTQQTSMGLWLNKSIFKIEDSAENRFTGSVVLSSVTLADTNTAGLIADPASTTGTDYSDKFILADNSKNLTYKDNKLYYMSGKMMCVCGGKAVGVGDHECVEVNFLPWTSTNNLPTSGNYYLKNTVTLSSAVAYEEEGTVSIDLNGNDIILNADATYDRIFRVYNANETVALTINLTDSQSDGEVKANRANVANADAKMDYGTLVWMSQSGHEFNLYGGILDASAITKGGDGTAIRLNGGSTFNMYGGQIKGGTAASAGGAVYVNVGGVFNLYDGTVSGGNAADGGIFDVRGEVGNNNHGVLNVKGGTITGGNATNNGGNIRVLGGTLNIEGGDIIGGEAGNCGGSVFTNAAEKTVDNVKQYEYAVVNVSGGYIRGGTCGNANSAYNNFYPYKAYVTLTGGTFDGFAIADAKSTLTVSGNVTINADEDGNGLYIDNSSIIPAFDAEKTFTGNILVTYTKVTSGQIFSGYNAEKHTGTIRTDVEGKEILFADGSVYLTDVKTMCVCGNKAKDMEGHTCEEVEFHAWVSNNSLPKSGNYYLTDNVTLSEALNINTAGTLSIDLNGKDITLNADAASDRVFRINNDSDETTINAIVNLTDTATGGEVKVKQNSIATMDYGTLVWLKESGATFNLYSGILDGSGITGKAGAAVRMEAGSFNMYGGQLKGGKTTNGEGGTARISGGTFTLYGGTVSGGQTTTGNGGSFFVTGASSTLSVKGGEITGGYATNVAGNIFVAENATLRVSGTAEIYGGGCGNALQRYANIQVTKGDAIFSGGVVSGIALDGDGYLTLSGNAVINAIDEDSYGLYIKKPVSFDETNGDFTGSVVVSEVNGSTKVTNAAESGNDYSSLFISKVEGKVTVFNAEDGCIYLQEGKMMCVCGDKAAGMDPEVHTCTPVAFLPWTKTTSMPNTAGNYYLKNNVTIEANATTQAGTVIKTPGTINIDLNGFNYTVTGGSQHSRLFRMRDDSNAYAAGEFVVTVNLTNSQNEGGLVKLSHPNTTSQYGALVWLTESTVTFNMYDGVTLDASELYGSHGGVAVRLDKNGGTFNMYGGEIRGGNDIGIVCVDETISRGNTGNGGGSVNIEAGAKFNMYNGTVSGGKVTVEKFDPEDEGFKAHRETRSGGNFNVKGELNVFGGTISGGQADWNGGNIYISGSSASLKVSGDANIIDGSAYNVAGNIIVFGGIDVFVSDDAQIYGGVCYRQGETALYNEKYSNVQLNAGTLYMSGGTISGITADGTGYLVLSGDATINTKTYGEGEQAQTNLGLILTNPATIDEANGAFTGSVAVSVMGKIATTTNEAYVANFTSLVADYEPVFDVDGIYNQNEFRVGFGEVDITPTFAVSMSGYGNYDVRISDPNATVEDKDRFYISCVAITDKNGKTILMFSQDTLDSSNYSSIRNAVNAATGVPKGNIMLTASHTHGGPTTGGSYTGVAEYQQVVREAAAQAAVAALADQAPATMYFGTTETTGLNFIRHYTRSDGLVRSDNHQDNLPTGVTLTGHTTEVDAEMRVLKFAFADAEKKPVVLINWQCHPHKGSGTDDIKLTSDIVGVMRYELEKTGNYRVAYYQGGAGNISHTSKITSENTAAHSTYVTYGAKMAEYAMGVLNGTMNQVNTGAINVTSQTWNADAKTYDAAAYASAQQIVQMYNSLKPNYTTSRGELNTLAEKEGEKLDPKIFSIHHANATVNAFVGGYYDPATPEESRPVDGEGNAKEAKSTRSLTVSAITIGNEFAWSVMSGEQFAQTVKDVRDNDGYTYSFATAYTNGSPGYFPTEDAWDYGCYEADITGYARGTAETIEATLVGMLNPQEGE